MKSSSLHLPRKPKGSHNYHHAFPVSFNIFPFIPRIGDFLLILLYLFLPFSPQNRFNRLFSFVLSFELIKT
jgi:hypothetical protein